MMALALALLVAQEGPTTTCPLDEAQAFLDKRYGERLRERVRAIAGRSPVRWIMPGSAVTQDWVPDRLNLEVGDDGFVHKVRCG